MTTSEAKRILHEMINVGAGTEAKEAIQIALDCMEEGRPGRVTHDLKLSLNFCDAVYTGAKTFELRKNDRGFQTGDLIRFTPIKFDESDPAGRFPEHPISRKLYEITYVLNGWGLSPDCVALSIREVGKD